MKTLRKGLLSIVFFVTFTGVNHGVEIGVGGRVGLGLVVSNYWPGNALAAANILAQVVDRDPINSPPGRDYVQPGIDAAGYALSLATYADIRFLSWLSLSPHLQFTFKQFFYHQDQLLKQDIEITHNVIDLEILAKTHLGPWYFAIGPGLTINSAPTLEKDNILSTILEIPGLQIEKKSTLGFNIVIDTGFYIPLGSKKHNITIGLRSSVDLLNLPMHGERFYLDSNNLPIGDIPEGRGNALVGYSPITVALTLGYIYRFI